MASTRSCAADVCSDELAAAFVYRRIDGRRRGKLLRGPTSRAHGSAKVGRLRPTLIEDVYQAMDGPPHPTLVLVTVPGLNHRCVDSYVSAVLDANR